MGVKQATALEFDSLRKQKRRSDYTIQFKLDVINYYLNSGKSIRDVAHKFDGFIVDYGI
ncbi:transposase [Lysinibacillus capsici]|uniref:transposase n=1 Tax=Lysinibacillus capsici TaxID=2115968 RepID=UPI002E1F4EDB|nr:transposase [Lysinibacillus capsici]